jgi:hypothetical protein
MMRAVITMRFSLKEVMLIWKNETQVDRVADSIGGEIKSKTSASLVMQKEW